MNPKDGQGKDITWRNAAALEGYVRRLNEVADRLADKNRWDPGIALNSCVPTPCTHCNREACQA
jgi:hypothetical protein